MTLLGRTSNDLQSEVCTKFKPTVLEGQLCYSLDLNLIATTKVEEGLDNGLLLILDPGVSEKIQNKGSIYQEGNTIRSLKLKPIGGDSSSARIYLNSLASYSDYRAGSYAMSALKRMTGTPGFLGLPVEETNCQVESFEACQTRGYLESVQAQCGCVPWALSSALTLEDKNDMENPIFCSPRDSSCYKAISRNITDCKVSCTGLYADVHFTEDKLLADEKENTHQAKGKLEITYMVQPRWYQTFPFQFQPSFNR